MRRQVLFALTFMSLFTSVLDSGAQIHTAPDTQSQEILGSLSGTVHTNHNEPAKDVRIELVPVTGLPGATVATYSAPDGRFEFTNLSHGKYLLKATKGVIESSQDIVVDSSQDWVSVGIDLDAASTDATVSVAELKIPSKARRALEKAKQAVTHNKLVDANRYIEKALAAWPHYCQALTLRAMLALSSNSFEEARSNAERAVEYDPNDGSAYLVLGDSYILLDRLDDAQRAVDRSIEIKPNAWQGYYDKGRILVIRRDWPGVLRAVAKASSLKTEDDPYLHLLKALAFAGMNDRPAAKNEVDAFRRLKPEASWSSQTRRLLTITGLSTIGNSEQSIPSNTGHANLP